MLGLTAAAVAVAPAAIVQAASPTRRAILGTSYVIPVHLGQTSVTAFMMEAPKGELCRATIMLPEDSRDLAPDVACNVWGIFSGNNIEKVFIERLGFADLNTLAGEVDAAIFNHPLGVYTHIDVGNATRQRPIEIEYGAMRDDTVLMLALWHTDYDLNACGQCPT
jgi:hypothetical protein